MGAKITTRWLRSSTHKSLTTVAKSPRHGFRNTIIEIIKKKDKEGAHTSPSQRWPTSRDSGDEGRNRPQMAMVSTGRTAVAGSSHSLLMAPNKQNKNSKRNSTRLDV
jgi:hypothetical protein